MSNKKKKKKITVVVVVAITYSLFSEFGRLHSHGEWLGQPLKAGSHKLLTRYGSYAHS